MADSKISALTAITTLTPATDVLPVVDVTGTTKKITTNQILGSGGTATLASATVTGDLTVDTNVLKVDSANNRVGIGTASPAVLFHAALPAATFGEVGRFYDSSGNGISFTANAGSGFNQITSTGAQPLIVNVNSSERYRIASDGVATWSNVGGVAGTAMTLNSTGLGVGTSPSYNIDVLGATLPTISVRSTLAGASNARLYLECAGANSGHITYNRSLQALTLGATGGTTAQVTLDSVGNVGIGVTPSAWRNTQRALQIGAVGAYFSSAASTGSTCVGRNVYENSAGDFTYIVNDEATFYEQTATGTHTWYTAAAGTGTISFGSAKMTLDASGNLLVGTTSSPLSSRVSVGVTNAQPDSFVIRNSAATAGLYWRLAYVNSANTFHILNQGGVGVYLTDGATSWTGTSDERLKDIIEPISNAVAKVGSLRSVIGKFKTDSEGTRRSFLIAQDVQAVLPEAVDTTNADAFGVRYSEVIPLLVAAIKELAARVQTLETR